MVDIILSHEKALKVVAKTHVFLGGRSISGFLLLLPVICREDFTPQKNWIYVPFLNLWEHLLIGILLTKTLLHYACRTISWEHRAQPLSNRSDCNNHSFIVTPFYDLAIIYLRFRKFASSLGYIPLPQPVWTDMQQGTIISLVRWQIFRGRSAFFCSSAGCRLNTNWQCCKKKKKATVILGYQSWNTACKAHEVMSPFCTALIRLLLQ